ncbi:MAG: alpha-1,2-fucosyltransferase, partial [Bacteroidota bacterium]
MIIVKLIGGLGNQMFQYAAGRQLAKIKNVVLKLDKSDLGITKEGITYREVEIDLLNAKIDWASNEDLNRFQLSKFRGIRVLQRKFPSLFKKAYVTE